MSTALTRRAAGCASDLTMDRWLLGELPDSDEGRRLEQHLRGCGHCGARVKSLRQLYAHQRPPRHGIRTQPIAAEPPRSTPDQTGIAQVIILRDGLLVGTEVFTPGSWVLGSDPRADLRLADRSVNPRHARLIFRGGRVGIEDLGGGLDVNGFRVRGCELRPVDETRCGPFVLRVRVIADRWTEPDEQVTQLHPVTPLGVAEARTEPAIVAPVIASPQPKAPPQVRPSEDELRLELRLFWGEVCQVAKSFGGGAVVASERDDAPMPMWGFSLEDFVIAERDEQPSSRGYRLFLPPGVTVERREANRWVPASFEGRFVVVELGATVRLRSGAMSLVASVGRRSEQVAPRPISQLPWQLPALSAGLLAAMLLVLNLVPLRDGADFEPRPLPGQVHFIAPSKPVVLPPVHPTADVVADAAVPHDVPVKHPQRHPAAAPPPHRAGGPGDKLQSQLDALRTSPIKAVTDALSGVPGKPAHGGPGKSLLASVGAPSGVGTQVVGINADGGDGIGRTGLREAGRFGPGRIGRGGVAGRVFRASTERIGAPRTGIDRGKVAQVINEHLTEVQRCYEAALLTHAGLEGKATLEWVITTDGRVRSVRTKSSTLQSPAVESCIITSLKLWRFPQAVGGDVTVSYPFIFTPIGF